MDTVIEKTQCKFCRSTDTIRYGSHKNIRRFWCKKCRRKFADNQALPHMKIPSDQIAPAVGSYYQGESLLQISHDFVNKYGLYVSDSTVRKWIGTFSRMGAHDIRSYHPNVGSTWIVNITEVTIDKFSVSVIDVIDSQTYFVLNSSSSYSLHINAICSAIENAQVWAGKKPEGLIVIDNLRLFNRIALENQLQSRGILTESFYPDDVDEYISQIKSTYLNRNKIISKLKNTSYIDVIIEGWEVHYNFHRIHELLGGSTPAERAGINYAFQTRY
jgi:transposase-like protein